jgi:hypothetical protein
MKAKKNGTPKEKNPKQERKPHPFGDPPDRAKGFVFPSPNPTLHVYAGKSVTALPQNLQNVFQAVEKYKDGVTLKDLKVTGLSKKTLNWLTRQLAKHEFLRVVAETPKLKNKKETK